MIVYRKHIIRKRMRKTKKKGGDTTYLALYLPIRPAFIIVFCLGIEPFGRKEHIQCGWHPRYRVCGERKFSKTNSPLPLQS